MTLENICEQPLVRPQWKSTRVMVLLSGYGRRRAAGIQGWMTYIIERYRLRLGSNPNISDNLKGRQLQLVRSQEMNARSGILDDLPCRS